jgi:hypothetical protein
MSYVLEIRTLLQHATDTKLLGNDLTKAIQAARKAKKLCDKHKSEHNVEPYRALAAYRLALVLLRQDPPLTRKKLEEIDDLLAFVLNHNYMGPWPYLYRMPVLNRLKAHRSHTKIATQKLEDSLTSAHLYLRNSYQQDRSVYIGHDSRENDYPLLVESHIFNALELACFLSDLPYSFLSREIHSILPRRIESMSDLPANSLSLDHIDKSIAPHAASWLIVTFSPRYASTPFPKPIIERQAVLDFQAAKERGHTCLLLVTGTNGELELNACKMTAKAKEESVAERFKGMSTKDLVSLLLGPGVSKRTKKQSQDEPGKVKSESLKRSLIRRRNKLRDLFGQSISFTDGRLHLAENASIILTISEESWDSLSRC